MSAIPRFAQAFKSRPMVFLNACEVGRPTVALAGIGGFAAAFLELGAAAVIAPLWSVKDTIAYEVAKKFYREGPSDRLLAERGRVSRKLCGRFAP